MGRVLQLLRELGLKLVVDVPVSTVPHLENIRQRGGLVRPSIRKHMRSIEK